MSKRFGYTNSIFSSHKNSRRGGATTLISSNVNVENIEEDEDQEGRYATAKGKCHSSSCVCTSRGGHTFDKITTKCDGNSWCGLEYDFNNIEDTTSFKQNREIINHSYKRDGALQRDAHPPKHGGGSKMGTADISDHNAIYLTMHQNKQTNIMENGVFNKKKRNPGLQREQTIT